MARRTLAALAAMSLVGVAAAHDAAPAAPAKAAAAATTVTVAPLPAPSTGTEAGHRKWVMEYAKRAARRHRRARDHRDEEHHSGAFARDSRDEAGARLRASEQAALHRLVARKQYLVSKEARLLKQLQEQEQALKKEHDVTAGKIKLQMLPRISATEQRLQRRRSMLEKTKEEAEQWGKVREKHKASALRLVADKKKTEASWHKAQEEVKHWEREEDMLRQAYHSIKDKATQEYQAFTYSRTKYEAAQNSLRLEEAAAKEVQDAVEHTKAVLQEEEDKVDQALAAKLERLHHRMAGAQELEKKAEKEAAEAKTRFLEWERAQKEVEQERHEREARLEAFERKRRQIFERAEEKAHSLSARWGGGYWH